MVQFGGITPRSDCDSRKRSPNCTTTRDENHFINIVGSLPIGHTLRLTVWRNKQAKAVDLTISDWPRK